MDNSLVSDSCKEVHFVVTMHGHIGDHTGDMWKPQRQWVMDVIEKVTPVADIPAGSPEIQERFLNCDFAAFLKPNEWKFNGVRQVCVELMN